MTPDRARWRRLALGALAASLLFTYSVFFTGDIVSGDNIAQYFQTVQIVDRHRLTFSSADVAAILRAHNWGLNTRFSRNRDGSTYSQVHGIGQPLLTLPLFVTVRVVKAIGHLAQPTDMTAWCLNWLLFAVIEVFLVFAACCLLDLGPLWTTSLVIAAAFASPIWLYTTAPFNVVGEMLAILAAADLCLWLSAPNRGDGRRRQVAAAGLAFVLTLSIVIRPFMATAVPAFIVWFWLSEIHSPDDLRARLRVIGTFVIALGLGAIAIAGYNAHYFGSPIATAYHDLSNYMTFDGPWTPGFTGAFFSPLESPLYFFPLIVLMAISVPVLIWRRDPVGWFVVLFLLPQVYLMPKYTASGGPDLFARFWARVVPVALLSVVAMVPYLRGHRRLRLSLLFAVLVLVLLGTRAQFLTVMTDERDVYQRVAGDVSRHDATMNELGFHQAPLALIAGATPVSAAQIAARNEPRRFLFFRSITVPTRRAGIALGGMLATIMSAFACAALSTRDIRAGKP